MPIEVVAKLKDSNGNSDVSCVQIKNLNTIHVHKKDNDPIKNDMIEVFKFNSIIPITANPNQIYGKVLLDKIDQIKLGSNLLLMTYGQHKSGKTHALFGDQQSNNDGYGFLPRCMDHILQLCSKLSTKERTFTASIRVLRISNDKLFDVLHQNDDDIPLRIMNRKNINENITWVQNAQTIRINCLTEFNSIINNIDIQSLPSFNHIVYTLYLEFTINQKNQHKHDDIFHRKKTKKYIYSQIHFVEIASCDKLTHYLQKKSDPLYPISLTKHNPTNTHQQANKFLHQTLESLVTMFTFIKQNAKFLPLRNTKLTHLLKDCLIDPTSNIIIYLTIIQFQNNLNETIKTLRFGEQIYQQFYSHNSISKSSNVSNTQLKRLPLNFNDDSLDGQQIIESNNIIELLYEIKSQISNPSRKRSAINQRNINEQISNIILTLRQNNNELMNCKNTIFQLQNENENLKQQIEEQKHNYKEIEYINQNGNSSKENESIELPKSNVDSKINDIEQRLKKHTKMLKSLKKESEKIHDIKCVTKSTSSVSPLSENSQINDIQTTQFNELEKVLATRHTFESLDF